MYWGGVYLLEMHQYSLAHDGYAQFLLRGKSCRGTRDAYSCGIRIHTQCHAIVLCLQHCCGRKRARGIVVAGGWGELCRKALVGRYGYLKDSASAVYGFGRYDLSVGCGNTESALQGPALLVSHFPCHTLLEACNEASSFRKQLQCGFGVVGRILVVCRQGAQSHVLGKVARSQRPVVHGEDTRIEFLVIAIVIACHILAEEVFLCPLAMRLFRNAPVQLPLGIGSQFIVSSIQCRVCQGEITISFSLLQCYHLAFHKIAIVIEKFTIQDSAQVCWLAVISTTYIRLII